MPSTSRDRPHFLDTWWEKLIAAVVLIAGFLLILQWWQGRQPSEPTRTGMAPATVVSEAPATGGRTDLTLRYSVDGHIHEVTKAVDAAAFSAQGKVAWVCYAPTDAGDAAIRLPQDPLCGQK